jgi:hypothetical protein
MTHRYIPPTGYESMKQCLHALRKVVPDLLAKLRPELKANGLDYLPRSIPAPEFILKAVEGYAYKLYEYDGVSKEQAIADSNFLGQHLAYMLNFELLSRKVFWADDHEALYGPRPLAPRQPLVAGPGPPLDRALLERA